MTPLTQRYRDLALALRAEVGAVKGWRTPVAQQLGVSTSFLSKMIAGKLEVSPSSAANALKRLELPADYFKQSRDYHSFRAADRPIVSANERALSRVLDLATNIYMEKMNGREAAKDLLALRDLVTALPWVTAAIRAHGEPDAARECAGEMARALSDMQAVRHALHGMVSQESSG